MHKIKTETDSLNSTRNNQHLKTCAADLDGSAHDHDGIVQRPLRLLCELLGPAPQDDGACLCLRAALKEVVPTQKKIHNKTQICHFKVAALLFLSLQTTSASLGPGSRGQQPNVDLDFNLHSNRKLLLSLNRIRPTCSYISQGGACKLMQMVAA